VRELCNNFLRPFARFLPAENNLTCHLNLFGRSLSQVSVLPPAGYLRAFTPPLFEKFD
jgi:hypothetical protein